jgi:hypothetical protein
VDIDSEGGVARRGIDSEGRHGQRWEVSTAKGSIDSKESHRQRLEAPTAKGGIDTKERPAIEGAATAHSGCGLAWLETGCCTRTVRRAQCLCPPTNLAHAGDEVTRCVRLRNPRGGPREEHVYEPSRFCYLKCTGSAGSPGARQVGVARAQHGGIRLWRGA